MTLSGALVHLRARLSGMLPGRGGGGLAIAVRAVLAATAATAVVLSSVMLYGVFYRLYVPQLLHEAPVYLQYATPPAANTTAVVDLVPASDYKFLSTSQAYSVALDLDVPTSEANQQIGNFMVAIELCNRQGVPVHQSVRPSIVPHQSALVHLLRTAVRAVPLALGLSRESVRLHVPLIEAMYDKHFSPITNARISLSRPLQVYSAHITIRAQFSGLRYWMFYWRLPTAVAFVSAAIVWQLVVTAIAWSVIESYTSRSSAETPHLSLAAAPASDLSADEDASSAAGAVAAPQRSSFQQRHFSGSSLGSPLVRALTFGDPQLQQQRPRAGQGGGSQPETADQSVPSSKKHGSGDDDSDDGGDAGSESDAVPDSPTPAAQAPRRRPSAQSLRRRPSASTKPA